MGLIKIRRALLSVSDKSGLVELGRGLARHGVDLVSTGGTHRTLSDAGLKVREISDLTGFPEMLDGRVKTLHPKVHGGILHRRDLPEHLKVVAEHGIEPIDLVVVNLYPFEQTVARRGVALEEAIENIDIGGPSMIRSASKNFSHVGVLTDPAQYERFLAELDANGGAVSQELLRELATAAFDRTSRYDAAIHAYLSGRGAEEPPAQLSPVYVQAQSLRYGENPHQKAALYLEPGSKVACVARAVQKHGKELSYNNLLDSDAALALVREIDRPAVAIIKHNNPCGAAVGKTLHEAFLAAWAGDPVSAFGSVIAVNRPIDEQTAVAMSEPGRFVEVILAPSFEPAAFETLTTVPTWRKNVRLLEVGDLSVGEETRRSTGQLRQIEGGMLWQSANVGPNGFENRKIVTEREPSASELEDLELAWLVVKHVKSNAIVLVKGGATVGVGAGQMSRVDSVHLATKKAGDRAKGSVMASDAFFPFRDNVDLAFAAGVTAIIQPGGSMRDQESIDACNEHGLSMLFTGMRHFKH
jgi:phosphoribosylaminoimidazolecarboxamide formyltransferase/IMP cyclohydrolase